MQENDSNKNSEVRTIRISYSLDAPPEEVKGSKIVMDYFRNKCLFKYHTPFKLIKSEDGKSATMVLGVPAENVDELIQDFVYYVNILNTSINGIFLDPNILTSDKDEILELKKREIEKIWKQYQPDSYDLGIIKDIIQKGERKRIEFLYRLITEYQPKNISFSTLVDLKREKIFDYDKAEKNTRENFIFAIYREQKLSRKEMPDIAPQPAEEETSKQKVAALENTMTDNDSSEEKNPKEEKLPAEISEEYQKEFPASNDNDDGVIRLETGDILRFIDSDSYSNLSYAIDLDMDYFAEKVANRKSPKELALMLTTFLLNYNEENADIYLYYLTGANRYGVKEKVINSRVCNVPIVQFAVLNNDCLARKLISDFGADENIQTPESSNPEYVSTVAKLFGYGRKKEISISEAIKIARSLVDIPDDNITK